jgi:hypothetical protein
LSKKIADATNKELAVEFSKVYFLIGLRPQHCPNEEQSKLIFDYIRFHYPVKTIKEIYLAFDLAIHGKYEVDHKVFDQFTIEYFVRIFNAYRKYLVEMHKILQENTKLESPKIEYKVNHHEEMEAEIEEFLQQKQIDFRFLPIYLYNYLERLNKISLSIEEKKEYYQKAIQYFKKQLQNENNYGIMDSVREIKRFDKLLAEDSLTDDYKINLKDIAKRMVVFDYWTKNKK